VRKGDTIPRINSAVDIVNWCSLEFQLPYGLYDFSKVSGPVTMRLGTEGESYAGIRKDEVNVGGRITVVDDVGAFGNPTSDSARTMVTPSATELLIVVYAPAEIAKAQIESVLSTTAERFARITGGSEAGRAL
jgi:DNA/RNA-binding domain of Phe-tRNA-synthetase-like protein